MTKPRSRAPEQRDRGAFGGHAGIWLKKRKQSVHPANDDDAALHHKKVTPPSINNNNNVMVASSNNKVDEAQLMQKAATTKRTVVGWDDVRCRPIYRETSSSGASTSSTSVNDFDDEEVEDVNETRDDVSDDDDRSVEDDREVVSSVLTPCSNDKETRKTRAYGSRKRKPTLSSSRTDISKPKRQQVTKKKDPVAAVMTPSINRMAFDLATPQTTGHGNICDALNSETKASPVRPVVSSNDTKVSTRTAKPKKEKQGISLLMKGKKKAKQQQQPALPSLAELDFVDETVTQPSSKTSLVAAKAFFERLDAQQTLTLDSSETPVAQGKRCVRTRRAIHIQSDTLREEYDEYASATKATGVEPLSVEQYALNRSAFFRTGDMYDGFLDG